MRDIKRIPKVLEAVKMLWEENPDYRFFQMVEYLRGFVMEKTTCKDPFFVEDDTLLRVINKDSQIQRPCFWENKWKITVVDPDGWNLRDEFSDCSNRITEEEFFKRASESTCCGNLKAFHEYYSTKK